MPWVDCVCSVGVWTLVIFAHMHKHHTLTSISVHVYTSDKYNHVQYKPSSAF